MNSDVDALRATRRGMLTALIATGLTLLALVGYSHLGANVMPNGTAIELHIGEKGESFVHRIPALAVDRQPAGLNFYTFRWSVHSMGAVIIKHGTLQLPIENVISVTSTEDMDYIDEGISEIAINSAITHSEKILHDEARVKTFAFLQGIVRKGWKVTIPRSMARIRGKDMNNYMLEDGKATTLDPSYIPTLSEWMRYEDLTTWEFYFDRAFLTVQISREHTLTDPTKPGVYLLSTRLQNEPQHFRGYVDGFDRPRWRELLLPKITELAESRVKREAAFRIRGIPIDDKYVDPPVPNLSK
ncbi:MAG: hypothetical protein JWQ01_2957 [Massilia sp.]|nr:hypothetical protein [Massilia sp.]